MGRDIGVCDTIHLQMVNRGRVYWILIHSLRVGRKFGVWTISMVSHSCNHRSTKPFIIADQSV